MHVYFHEPGITAQLDQILSTVQKIQKGQTATMADLTALTAQIAKNEEIEASAVILIQGIAAQIASMANDPVALRDLTASLNASATSLSEAIAANTPAAEPPPADPAPAAAAAKLKK